MAPNQDPRELDRHIAREPFPDPKLPDPQPGWSPSSDDWFELVHSIQFSYRSSRDAGLYSILESVGGGVAMLDFDLDGDLDLVFAGGGTISPTGVSGHKLAAFRNDGDWQFVDVTAEIGLDLALDYSHGLSVTDYNRDGWPDLFVTCYGRSRLLRNDHGRFVDVTDECGLTFDGWSTGAAWFDANQDGWPDLFVIGYVDWEPGSEPCRQGVRDVCPPQKYGAAKDRLFISDGRGGFRDQSDGSGIRAGGKGLGVIASDFNSDGLVDLYVANDAVANQLYKGKGDGTFHEIGDLAGVSVNAVGAPEGSMGVDFGDVDTDGRGDLWVTNFQLEDNSLYRNIAEDLFQHATVASGLGGSNRTNVGFGTGLVDFDLDGSLDLFVVNGHVLYHAEVPLRQYATLHKNTGGLFHDVTDLGGEWFGSPHVGRGAAWGDLDGDGDQDLVIVSQDEPVALLRNRHDPKDWIGFRLTGSYGDPQAVGSVLRVSYHGKTLVRWITSGSGYLSHSDPTIYLPVERDAHPVQITVDWAGGQSETFGDLAKSRVHRIVQGKRN